MREIYGFLRLASRLANPSVATASRSVQKFWFQLQTCVDLRVRLARALIFLEFENTEQEKVNTRAAQMEGFGEECFYWVSAQDILPISNDVSPTLCTWTLSGA